MRFVVRTKGKLSFPLAEALPCEPISRRFRQRAHENAARAAGAVGRSAK
jgi:hypothetical protein